MVSIFGAVVLFGVTSAQLGGDPSKDMLLVGDKAYGMMLSVRVCCPAQVTRASWSADGSYALFLRQDIKLTSKAAEKLFTNPPTAQNPPPIETTISVWNRTTETTMDVWKDSSPDARVGQLEWVTGSSVALASITQYFLNPSDPQSRERLVKQSIVEIDARSGSVRVLRSQMAESATLGFTVSKNSSRAAVFEHAPVDAPGPRSQSALQIYRPGSGLQQPVSLPEGTVVFSWDRDGRSLILIRRKPTSEGQKPVTEYGLYDSQTGRVAATDEEHISFPAKFLASKRDLAISPDRWSQNGAYASFTQNLQPIWLVDAKTSTSESFQLPSGTTASRPMSSKPEGALITAEAEFAAMCPTGEGVLYVTRGVAMYRPIVSIPKDMYLKAKAAAERAVLMSNAKQVALGLIMYASDHGDNMPGASDNWQNLIDPYLRNNTISNGFNYTFAGGNLSKVDKPAEIELGHFMSDGGRIVAYVDGHVRWVPDK